MQQQLTRQQQQQFAQEMNNQLERMTMGWDNDLRQWYSTAIKALDFSSAVSLNVPQNKVLELHSQEKQGLNMNVVMALSNNLEARTPIEMGVTAKDWAEFLQLNTRVAQRWNELVAPMQQKLLKEFEIMNNKPRLVKMGEA